MIGLASRLLWGIPILLGAVALLGADLLGWSDGYGLWILCLVFGTGATYEALSMLDHPQGFRLRRDHLRGVFDHQCGECRIR